LPGRVEEEENGKPVLTGSRGGEGHHLSSWSFTHLGLDMIVSVGTALRAPLEATLVESVYDAGEGNYGGYVLLKHESPLFETFYAFCGHRRGERLPKSGEGLRAGAAFAEIGDSHENGNWFHHTHIRVTTGKGPEMGYLNKGYCSREDLWQMNDLCLSPIPVFRIDQG
jgi:hypothetical protein